MKHATKKPAAGASKSSEAPQAPQASTNQSLNSVVQQAVAHEASLARTAQAAEWSPYPFVLGGLYFIRTVTMANTGILVGVTPTELVLVCASWVADTGRFADSLVSGEFSEVEPFPVDRRVIVGRGAIVDAVEIPKLPLKQK